MRAHEIMNSWLDLLKQIRSDAVHWCMQHSRLPCPSPPPGVHPNSCPLSWWRHPTILSSVVPFSCLQSFQASGSFPVSAVYTRWRKYWSFNFSIRPFNEYSGLISFGIDYLISLQSKGLSRVFSSTTIPKHQFFSAQPSLWSRYHICTCL